eukprot:CAMPEP_0196822554 /NCGR_PEP_ID=MMETSP1362-20130617/83916_1 /TAXON_ID=163516 /ORGANISM="Leptocylindrus danicus, Strain CCMP1856" /LENGTH=328 /DNA_ID=CAMNT_0042202139 /DNA_START=70 /DNA_END=1056 /DNA_ORIENTATION=+
MAEAEALASYNNDTGIRRRSPRSKAINTKKLHRIRTIFWSNESESSESESDGEGSKINENSSVLDENDSKEEDHNSTSTSLTITKQLNFGGRLNLSRIHTFPHIYTIDNFLTSSELHYFDSIIKQTNCDKKFQKSYIDQGSNGHDQSYDDVNRTSQFLQFNSHHNSKIAAIESRAAELLGVCVECIEPVQLVKYEAGQYFNVHHDLGVLYEDGSVELPVRPPRRVCTIFVYLNDVPMECGGCTRFPLLFHDSNNSNGEEDEGKSKGLCVQPVRGRALLWCNVDEDGRPEVRTVHSGEAIVNHTSKTKAGDLGVVKYGINIWVCERMVG